MTRPRFTFSIPLCAALALALAAPDRGRAAEGGGHGDHAARMKHAEHGGHGAAHGAGHDAGHGAKHGAGHGGHGAGGSHAAHAAPAPGPSEFGPSELGQGAFAAVAEIVALLQADPTTDWSRVDIPALVAHLRDMDAMMTVLTPRSAAIPGGLRFTIHRDDPGAGAAWRMIPAHMPMLEAELGVSARVEIAGDVLTLDVAGEGREGMIRALGLPGLMATGAHHQAHHFALASGADPHAH